MSEPVWSMNERTWGVGREYVRGITYTWVHMAWIPGFFGGSLVKPSLSKKPFEL